MALYDARCDYCGAVLEYQRSISEAWQTPDCPRCGGRMTKVILSAPKAFVKGNFEPFVSVVDGTVIRTNRDMQEHNKRNNVVNLADGYDDATVRAGTFNKRPEKSKRELAEDISQSIRKLEDGYKPVRGAEDEW